MQVEDVLTKLHNEMEGRLFFFREVRGTCDGVSAMDVGGMIVVQMKIFACKDRPKKQRWVWPAEING